MRVSYPGVWLADRVWATHGHYLDRHLLPEAAYGVARGLLGRLPRDGATPADYEGGPSATRVEALLTRWLPRPLAELMDELAELLRAATMPGSPRRVLGRRLAPFAQRALGAQMRRASIPALARVVHRLGVDADWVLFGHVHRCGPLAGDVLRQWSGPGGVPRIANTGSWVYEPLLLHRVDAAAPVLARRRDPAGRGRRARGDRPARPPRRRGPSPLELEHDLAGRAALVDAPSAPRAASSSGKRSPTIGLTKPSSTRRSISAPISRLSSGLTHT